MTKKLDEFGVPSSIIKNCGSGPFKRSSVITVVCACGAEAELQIGSIIRTIKRVGQYKCLSCGMKAKCQDAAYKEKVRSGAINSWSPERRACQSKISKKLWSNDEFRSRQVEASNRTWSDPVKRKQVSEKIIALYATEEHRAKCRLACSSPEERNSDMLRLGVNPRPSFGLTDPDDVSERLYSGKEP